MSRGYFYTEDEDKKLMAVLEDSEDSKLIDVARKAQRYGICTARDERALAQHIGKLKQPKEEDEMIPPEEDFYEAIIEAWERLYFGLRSAVLNSASLYKGSERNSLSLNYKEILRWFWRNDSEAISARIEQLEFEEGLNA